MLKPQSRCQFVTYGDLQITYFFSELELKYQTYNMVDGQCQVSDIPPKALQSDTYLQLSNMFSTQSVCAYYITISNYNEENSGRLYIYRNSASMITFALVSLLSLSAFLFWVINNV